MYLVGEYLVYLGENCVEYCIVISTLVAMASPVAAAGVLDADHQTGTETYEGFLMFCTLHDHHQSTPAPFTSLFKILYSY